MMGLVEIVETTKQVEQVVEYTAIPLAQFIVVLGGVLAFMVGILSFFIRRGVFKEIDNLKEGKQDKPFCGLQKALCDQAANTICGEVEEIKISLKEGREEFKVIGLKIERIMGKMKIRFDDLNGGKRI